MTDNNRALVELREALWLAVAIGGQIKPTKAQLEALDELLAQTKSEVKP